MSDIKIVYIDDQIDVVISKYMDKYTYEKETIHYDEVEFNSANGYESLLCDDRVIKANVILIDSQLFENSNATSGKYTGEQFKLILKKMYPFIEVIVITQNVIREEYSSTIAKYNKKNWNSQEEYFEKELSVTINKAIAKVCEYRSIMAGMERNEDTSYLLDKITNSLDGLDTYDELKKTDIDELINLFKQIQENIDGGL